MTTDDFTKAARARIDAEADAKRLVGEAMRDAWTDYGEFALLAEVLAPRIVEWARTHLAAQEPTDAEETARFAVEHKHQIHGTQCLCGFESARSRSRTEHIMACYFDELSAARAARRDEEPR